MRTLTTTETNDVSGGTFGLLFGLLSCFIAPPKASCQPAPTPAPCKPAAPKKGCR